MERPMTFLEIVSDKNKEQNMKHQTTTGDRVKRRKYVRIEIGNKKRKRYFVK